MLLYDNKLEFVICIQKMSAIYICIKMLYDEFNLPVI